MIVAWLRRTIGKHKVRPMRTPPVLRRIFTLASIALMLAGAVASGQARAEHIGVLRSAPIAPCHQTLHQNVTLSATDRCREICLSMPSDMAGEVAAFVTLDRPHHNDDDAGFTAIALDAKTLRAAFAPVLPRHGPPPRDAYHVTPRLLI